VETKLNRWLAVGAKIRNAYITQTHPTGSGNSGVTSMSGMFKNDLRPFMPVKHPDGNWAGQGSYTNPVAVAAEGGNSKTQNNDLWMTGVVKLTPIKNLFVQADYTWNAYTSNQTSRNTAFMEYGVDGVPLAEYPWTSRPTYIYKYSSNDYYQAFNAFAQYDLTIAKSHNFKFMTGYNQEKKVNGSFSAQRNDLMSGNSHQFGEATGDRSVGSSATQWSINSWFGRINYDFEGKYLAEFVWRYDGSSKFPSGDRYGFFPSGSLGWRISEENFWEGMRGWWNNMKLRVSYGRLGNQAVGSNFPYIANMNYGTLGYILGSYTNRPQVVQAPGLVSATLTWEKVDQLDLGFDAAFLGNRLTAEFDWYQRDTKGMLTAQKPLPGVLGTGVPNANAADLRTNGWELALRWNDRVNSIGLNYYG
ncbi:MAG: TonB-dependent receptor, partial [Paramuribaculum sp.]|nr:TonB-dependent receptor [Paramuribaculum sp.]